MSEHPGEKPIIEGVSNHEEGQEGQGRQEGLLVTTEERLGDVAEVPHETSPKIPVGSKYQATYPDLVRKFCMLGADDEKLGEMFAVHVSTIRSWRETYPEFAIAMMEGRDIADAEIAHSLYHRAKGYSHPEVHIATFQGQVIKTNIMRHYPPDTLAAIYWLQNRQNQYWRDRRVNQQHGSANLIIEG